MTSEEKKKLIRLSAESDRLRARLERDGLFGADDSDELAGVQSRDANFLQTIIDQYGFPEISRDGADASAAAARLVYHAIGLPDFQRRCLGIFHELLERGEIAANVVAMLEDRIRYFEGRAQLYGTNLDWDESGKFGVTPIENEAELAQRRAFMGLPALRGAAGGFDRAPLRDPARQRAEFLAWLKKVGWRS